MALQGATFYFDGVQAGDRRILAKAITLIESSHPDHRIVARELIEMTLPHSGKAIRVGITGVPGAGKSTFIESFGSILTGLGHQVAVLAVDPSSKRSGGSILADKTRMEKLSVDPNAFIRPSPSGDTLGGVARMTRETILLCEAAGFDVILVETVGVGQSETTVAEMVDFFLMLMITGAGDTLQGIKKGILEMVDAVAITKADGDNMQRAEATQKELTFALHLLQPTTATWHPQVVTCSALTLAGLDALWDLILKHNQALSETGELQENRRRQALQWMKTLLQDRLRYHFLTRPGMQEQILAYEARITRGEITPDHAARELYQFYQQAD